MKLSELRKKTVERAMPMGRNEVVFDHIAYQENEDGDVTRAQVFIEGFKPLTIPVFEEQNFQLDLLTEQLGIDSYSDKEINKAKGTVIIAHKYVRFDEARAMEFTNISFNPRYGAETAPTVELA